MRRNLLGMVAAAAMAMVSASSVAQQPRARTGQPYRGTAGMAYGTKTRGNRAVQRASAKARNVKRHRQACRG